MNAKTIEHFHDSIISLYKEMIQEALLESEIEARSHLDTANLEKKVNEIISSAGVDGLERSEIKTLVDDAITEWMLHHKIAV